ncbi:MAG: DNA alkylation repair protein [Planctomycetes bacterium]|nr:DNA alkylation repair protein [Planctomycetota bacterium]
MNFSREVAALRVKLTAMGTPARAEKAKSYLKSELTFLGVDAKGIRQAAKEFCAAFPEVGRAQLTAFVKALWKTGIYEHRAVGVGILELRRTLLEPPDLAILEDLLRHSHTWALVDWLAVHVVGDLVTRNKRLTKDLERWAKDKDFWLRRSALLALLLPLRAGKGDLVLFEKLAVPMFGETEFFIQKAIGWVLREAGKKQPAAVRAFLERHGDAMATLSRKEASRRLGDDDDQDGEGA